MDQLEFQLDVNFVSHVGIYVAYDLAQSAQLPPPYSRVLFVTIGFASCIVQLYEPQGVPDDFDFHFVKHHFEEI